MQLQCVYKIAMVMINFSFTNDHKPGIPSFHEESGPYTFDARNDHSPQEPLRPLSYTCQCDRLNKNLFQHLRCTRILSLSANDILFANLGVQSTLPHGERVHV